MARILHILGDSKYGGGSVLIEKFAAEAMRHGHRVSVLAKDSTFQEHLRKANVGIVDLDCIWRPIRPLRDFMGLLRLRRYLSKEPYDIIHTHTSKAGFVGRLAARWARIPVVVHTVHGFAFHEGSSRHVLLAYSLLERMAAQFCDALVTVSQFHCDWAARLRIGNAHTRLAIPNGIDPGRVKATRGRAATRKDLGLRDGEIMCLTAGRLAKQKGLDVLIRAVAALPSNVSLRCFLAGDGEERAKLEQMVEGFGLSQKVVFLGFRADLGDLLCAADFVVLPSLREGLSIALLEAMAAGKAIITTDIGSNMEVGRGGESARIVRSGNESGLVLAVAELANNRQLREDLGCKALAEFQRSYREEIMLASYMALYDRLLHERGADKHEGERPKHSALESINVSPLDAACFQEVVPLHQEAE